MSETTDNARESSGEVMRRFIALEQRLADIERRFFPTVANHADFIDRANTRLHGIERRLDRLDER